MSKNTGTSELINYFDLGVNGDVGISGNLTLDTIANATTDTDTFLVSDTGIIKYRTGAQLLSDIGAQAAGNYVTTDTSQAITANKSFTVGFSLASEGSGNQTSFFRNTSSIFSGSGGSNIFGFNNSNNIYFGKGLNNGGVLQWNNTTATRYYTLPDSDGTLALTSQIPANPVGGTGAFGRVAYWNAAGTITSDSLFQWNDTFRRLGIGCTPTVSLDVVGAGVFSSSVTSDSLIISNNDARIRNNDATGRIILSNSSTNTFAIFYGTSHPTQANQTVFANGGITTCTFFPTGAATFSSSVNIGTTASNTYGTLNIVQQSVSAPSFVRGIELVHPNGTGVTGGYLGISITGQKQGTIQVGDDATVGNLLLQSQGGNVLIGTTTDNGSKLQVNGAVNSRAASTNAGLGATTFIGAGEFMSTGSLSGYFWENRSGGVSAYSNWYGWYTSSGVVNLYNGSSNLLSINGTSGAATFSSSVTQAASDSRFLGGDVSGRLIISNSNTTTYLGLYGASHPSVPNILEFVTNSALRMLITNTGNVGIGTASPSALLSLGSSVAGKKLLVYESSNAVGGLGIASGEMRHFGWSSMTEGLTFGFVSIADGTTYTERMRITSGGSVLIGQQTSSLSTNGWLLHGVGGGHTSFEITNNEAFIFNNRTTGTTYQIDFRTNSVERGSISVTDSATSYNTSSDYRLKENVKPVKNALSVLTQLKPYTFNFIVNAEEEVMGFLAHEVQEVMPQAIKGEKDAVRIEQVEVSPAELDEEGNVITEAVIEEKEVPVYQGIDHSKLVPLLVAAIQELKTEIDTLKN